MVSRNTILVPSLGLRIRPACEAGLSAGMRRERVPPRKRKKERKVWFLKHLASVFPSAFVNFTFINFAK